MLPKRNGFQLLTPRTLRRGMGAGNPDPAASQGRVSPRTCAPGGFVATFRRLKPATARIGCPYKDLECVNAEVFEKAAVHKRKTAGVPKRAIRPNLGRR